MLYELRVVVGLILFVVPGIVIAVREVLYGPVIVVEHGPAGSAGRRSRELVRGSFARVGLLVAIMLLILAATSAAGAGAATIEGVGIAVTYYVLRGIEQGRDAVPAAHATGPAEAGPGEIAGA